MMNQPNANQYDLIPYPLISFIETHPDRMATIARLCGLSPTPVERCRVLELGCARGGNLIPMAYANPSAQFLGIDLSHDQIAYGQNIITYLDLRNVEIRCQDISDFDPGEGKYDYIIAHGIYSWVSSDIQKQILKICHDHLSENGIAYLSYNVLPGWSLRGATRDLLYYLTRNINEPVERFVKAIGILDLLIQNDSHMASQAYKDYMGKIASSIQEDANRGNNFNYWVHEYFEEHNQPLYFHQFVEQLEKAGLHYLGDSELFRMFPNDIPSQQNDMLQRYQFDVLEFEQCLDFLRNRSFRRSLVCRSGPPAVPAPLPERFTGLRIASAFRPTIKEFYLNNHEPVKFVAPDEVEVTMTEPIAKSAFVLLFQAYPDSIPFTELVSKSRTTSCETRPDGMTEDDDASAVCRALWQACTRSPWLDLTTWLPPYIRVINERPIVSEVVRVQSRIGVLATNLRHGRIQLEEIDQWLIQRLNGENTLADLAAQMLTSYQEGSLALELGDYDETDLPQMINQLIAQKLERYSTYALLVG